MSWEDSKACTPLKRDFLREWFAQEQRFFLTGGSALGIFYLDHRRSYDLDLFTTETVESKEVQNLVLRVSAKTAALCTAVRSAPDFHRFKLTRGDEREIIDVVVDRAPQLDALKACVDGIRVDTLREILANKLTTLVSRSELKDLVDLYFLEKSGCDLLAAIPDARAKDGGWEPAVVAMLLDEMRVKVPPEWLIREVSTSELETFVRKLRLGLAERALPST
jgi:Nucleotidyl transferase AbiEii toxin, Type IV TA system